MTLPRAPEKYDASWSSENNRRLDQLFANTHRKKENVELATGEYFILRSPNGARWAITVSDAGVLGVINAPPV